MLIRNNLRGHINGKVKQFTTASTFRLTVVQLPSYVPEFDSTKGVWAHLKTNTLANLATRSLAELTRTVRRGLHHIQRHPALLTGFLAGTGLPIDLAPSTL